MPSAFTPIDLPDYDPAEPYDPMLIVAAIGEAVPHKQILTKGPEFVEFGKDTSMDSARPDIVVIAHETAEVQHVMYVADHFRVPVYARGLGSGLSGGAVPAKGGIVLDVSPMDSLIEVTKGNRSCVVGPGITVEKLNERLAEHGLWFPPWPSSHDISSIGGNIAENAGGITTVKYGTTKHWLHSLTCVLPGGRLLKTGSSAAKDVAGFDLTSLICGSEGMLCVVVEAELKLLPIPPAIGTAIYSFESDESAISAAQEVLAGPVTPRTLEFMDSALIECVIRQLGDEARGVLPADAGAVIALETDAQTEEDAMSQLESIGKILGECGGVRVGLTTDRAEALKLWRVRSELSPACHQLGEFKLSDDVCVPRHRMVEFIRGMCRIEEKSELAWLNYGHVGDGNFHVTLMFKDENDPLVGSGLEAIDELCKLAVELGGTISGEHGIGSAKANSLHLQLDEHQVELMRRVKQSFDPNGILNPGKWL